MAEVTTEKKKRGRPPKKTKDLDINENQSEIRMSQETHITTEQVQSRLSSIFNRVADSRDSVKYSNFLMAINRNNAIFNSAFYNNPFVQNQRLKQSNVKSSIPSSEELQKALMNPEDNEEIFKRYSMALYYQNYIYGNLLRLQRDIPKYFHYVIPQNISKEDLKKEKFIKEKQFVNKLIEKFNIPLTFKNVSLQVAQEGKCSYVYRESYDKNHCQVDYALLQKLPPQYIKYTGFGGESPLICSFDFLMFLNPMYDIKQWPDWMGKIWDRLLEDGIVTKDKNSKLILNPKKISKGNGMLEVNGGSYAYWVELPQDLVYTFGIDFSNPLVLPEAIGMFADLSELDNYKWLQTQTLLTNITNILTASVPIEKDAKGGTDAAILTPEVILGLEGDCSASLNSNILPFFAPLEDFKMHSIDHIPNATDIVLSRLRDIVSTSGTSALINTSDKPSIAMIKGTQNLYESKQEYLTLQYEKFINMIINKFHALQYSYKCIIWGGTYNWRDDVKVLKELIQNGNHGFMPRLLSSYNMTIEEYKVCCDYVDYLEIFPNVENQKQMTSPSSSNDTNEGAGRKAKEESEIDNDNTAASIEGGQNVSENK